MWHTTSRLYCTLTLIVVSILLVPAQGLAAQPETSVTCDEGVIAEPIAMVYGNSTANCAINPAAELDRFSFDGIAGDVVRINVHGSTAFFDPALEIRDPDGIVIDNGSCSGGTSGCSFSRELTLPKSGSYSLALSDAGTNEAGNYTLQVEKILPAPPSERLDYDAPSLDALAPTTDIDQYNFFGTAGTYIRIAVDGTTAFLDPRVEVRDPNGTLVMEPALGASCNGSTSGCSFTVDISPVISGFYSLLVYDGGTNETGNYQIGLWCLFGPCDSDGDLIPDPLPPVISFDSPVTDLLDPNVDGDFFSFYGTSGTDIRIAVDGTTAFLDPRVEVRDPNGDLALGPADGAACDGGTSGCSFTVDFTPAMTGSYSVVVYDGGVNEGGNYQIGIWCLFGACDSDGMGVPDPAPPALSFVTTTTDTLEPNVDGDFFTFYGTSGTDIRIAVDGATAFLDPRVEVRDPSGDLVLGPADGAACNGSTSGCSFTVDFTPAITGSYSVVVYDGGVDEGGNYQIGLWCLFGDCDSDADGLIDGDREIVDYGDTVIRQISPNVDADSFILGGTAGDSIRMNVLGTTAFFDPSIEVRDPNGDVVAGPADGASCSGSTSGCSFSIDITPAITGTHYVVLYDGGVNESGGYQFSLQCLFGTCADLAPPPACGDNCSNVANTAQLDTNGDGIGNFCDPDFDDSGSVNFDDLAIMKSVFFTMNPDVDLDGDGRVNFDDLAIIKSRFFLPPGPSCATPNNP